MEKRLQELENKYFDLVSYARKPRDEDGGPMPMHILKTNPKWADTPDQIIKDMMTHVMRIQGEYPEETEALNDYEMADWSHGFNSGALAAFRWVMTAKEYGVEEADSEFPFLDT